MIVTMTYCTRFLLWKRLPTLFSRWLTMFMPIPTTTNILERNGWKRETNLLSNMVRRHFLHIEIVVIMSLIFSPFFTGFARANTNVGLYIETKRASYYRNLGLPLEENLVDVLENSTFKGPVIIQSFELDSLKLIRHLKPEWKTVKLLTRPELDHHTSNGTLSPFMESLSQHCDGIGPNKLSIIPNPEEPPKKSDAIDAAHAHDMFVHPYTFRSDVRHLHRVYGGNATQEFAEFFNLGVDGVFCDFPDHGVYARESCNLLRSQGVEYSSFYRVTE